MCIRDRSYPIECKVLPNPCFDGAQRYSIQQGAGMVVTKSDEKTEYAAAEFLKWFTDAERNIDFSIGSGYLPVKKEANDPALIEKAFAKGEGEVNAPLEASVVTSILSLIHILCRDHRGHQFIFNIITLVGFLLKTCDLGFHFLIFRDNIFILFH